MSGPITSNQIDSVRTAFKVIHRETLYFYIHSICRDNEDPEGMKRGVVYHLITPGMARVGEVEDFDEDEEVGTSVLTAGECRFIMRWNEVAYVKSNHTPRLNNELYEALKTLTLSLLRAHNLELRIKSSQRINTKRDQEAVRKAKERQDRPPLFDDLHMQVKPKKEFLPALAQRRGAKKLK